MKSKPSVGPGGSQKLRILVVDLEPTPYKTDLWNAFSDADTCQVFVVYTEQKNWSPDGGHNYQKWPDNRHGNAVLEGKGKAGALRAALFVARKIFEVPTDLIYIAGYVHLSTVAALICCILLRRKFVLHSDEFNNARPEGRFASLKWALRETLRFLVFRFGEAVLVCGRRGLETAILAGCRKEKLLDFPYVVDVDRLLTDAPEKVPQVCVEDLQGGAAVIFFSGRMIPRKGLPTLLAALSMSKCSNWVLWIEGDGLEMDAYRALAEQYGIDGRCRFLGFCQYDLHSWLIRSSEIVVVPSHVDPWGIVVDEGIQLGKTVISSNTTGSGYDRIEHGRNGFLFPAGDIEALSNILSTLIDDIDLRSLIGRCAMSWPGNVRPKDNQEKLLKLITRSL